MASLIAQTTREEIDWCLTTARTREIRTRRQWCEQELVPAEGPLRDQLWQSDSQPFQALFLDAMDSGRWPRVVATGCVQSGKSLIFFVVAVLYHLFELQETTIAGAPSMDINHDKWAKELRPIILNSPRLRDLMPTAGPGSREGIGNLESVTFKNGAELKFMSAGGGDEKRSSYTSRVVVATELDKMDTAGEASREADPVTQMEARSNSWDILQRQFYGECTVSIESGRVWQEYTKGTRSRIVCPCCHCGEFVTPEREHLQGWQQAVTELEALRLTHFVCPACEQPFTDAQRRQMNVAARLLHFGQSIDRAGTISGEAPDTLTLGLRWSAFNNLLWSSGAIGVKEWKALRADDSDAAERELVQFVWVVPHVPDVIDDTPLDTVVLSQRTQEPGKGIVPAETSILVTHVDIGKRVSWWLTMAWHKLPSAGNFPFSTEPNPFDPGPGPRYAGQIVDYGAFEVAGDKMDISRAILLALRDFRDDVIEPGFVVEGSDDRRKPAQVWIDARYKSQGVFAFCQESGQRYRAAMGFGLGKQYDKRYSKPGAINKKVRLIGEEYHIAWFAESKSWVVEVNADYWKSWLHRRLASPIVDEEGLRQPGSLTFYKSTDRNEHISLVKMLTAEKEVEEFIPGVGLVRRWERESKKNHHLDNAYNCCAAAHYLGMRLIAPPPLPPRIVRDAVSQPSAITPDGRPFLISERK